MSYESCFISSKYINKNIYSFVVVVSMHQVTWLHLKDQWVAKFWNSRFCSGNYSPKYLFSGPNSACAIRVSNFAMLEQIIAVFHTILRLLFFSGCFCSTHLRIFYFRLFFFLLPPVIHAVSITLQKTTRVRAFPSKYILYK